MLHPFTHAVINEIDRIEVQLSEAAEDLERMFRIKEDVKSVVAGMKEKQMKLTAARKHSASNFLELEQILNTGIYYPYCFVFHGSAFKLSESNKYVRHGMLECSACGGRLHDPR